MNQMDVTPYKESAPKLSSTDISTILSAGH